MEKLNIALKTDRETGDGNSSSQMYMDNTACQTFVCPVVANFEFGLQRSIICKACGQVILKTEPSHYLSINPPQETKLQPSSIQNSFDVFLGQKTSSTAVMNAPTRHLLQCTNSVSFPEFSSSI